MGRYKPPVLAILLFDLLCEEETRLSLLGDVTEAYSEMVEKSGRLQAGVWFWIMLFKSMPQLITEKLSWSMIMLKSYFKISMRNLMRHKGYSFINITGLSIGMACTIIILLWVQDELSFDEFHTNRNSIYRIVGDWEKHSWDGFEGTPLPLGAAVKNELPEIVDCVRLASHSRKVFRYKDKAFYEDFGLIADPSLFSVFTFPFVKGDPETAFSHPNTVVLSEEMAFKYFGTEDPIGKVIQAEEEEWTITGVVRNIPENSHIQFDYCNSIEFLSEYSGWGSGWNAFNFVQYLHLNDNSDIQHIGEKITEIAKTNNSPQVLAGVTFRLQPLSQIYLDARPYDRGWTDLGDSNLVYMFSLVAGIVLFIACVNFMNLATARGSKRAKEVGLRKTVGAVRSQLIKQFFGESIILSLFSFLIAMVLAALIIPIFNALSDSTISMNLLNIDTLLMLIGVALLTGFFSGIYPALYLSKFKPVSVLRSGFGNGHKKSRFRTLLVVTQFSIAVTLIIGSIFTVKQLNYVMKTELGFDKENVVYIPVKENIGPEYGTIKKKLLENPNIVSVSASRYVIKSLNRMSGFSWEGKDPEKNVDMILSGLEFGFFETVRLPLVEGRYFSEDFPADKDKSYILNEQAVREMGVENPVGMKMDAYGFGEGIVVGVVKDAHFRSMHYEIEPRFYYMTNLDQVTSNADVIARIRGDDVAGTIKHIEDVWNSINTMSPFEYSFLDETYENQYRREQRIGQLFNLFTLLAIAVSCLGLFGLSSFVIEQRTKEIGIRKVLGGSIVSIIFMLSKEFLLWISIAVLISWPIGYKVVEKLLESYSYKVPLELNVFVISGIIALLIAFLTISRQSLKAARANPAESLKYE